MILDRSPAATSPAATDRSKRTVGIGGKSGTTPLPTSPTREGRCAIPAARRSKSEELRIGHPGNGRIWLAVNGAVKQDSDLSELIWGVPEIISCISQSMTLAPGDLIMTGTPAGVGPIVVGDRVTGGIDGLGEIDITIT